MTALELREPIPVDTPLGPGVAVLWETGYWDTYWTVVLKTRAIVTFRQSQLRVQRNYSLGLDMTDGEMQTIVGGEE